jgi:hypothetical protein
MRQLAVELHVSYSGLMRLALEHGIARLSAHPSIIALVQAYDLTHSSAMSKGDQEALRRLNQVITYDFKHPQALRTTLAASKETAWRISDLAIPCGIPQPRLAVLAVLESVLTLANFRGYREALIDEMNAFYRFAVYRRRVLLMGDLRNEGSDARPRLL